MYLQRFQKVVTGVRNQFPTSPWITTQQAEDLLKSQQKVLLVDARLKDEFKVSKIPGAVNIPISSKAPEIKQKLIGAKVCENTKLITYCAISVRSSLMLNKIQKLTNQDPDLKIELENLLNMEGSIFKWAIENRHLGDENGKSTK